MPLPQIQSQQIDWRAPWLAHLPFAMQHIATATDLKAALNAELALRNPPLQSGNGLPLHFIAQEDLPAGVAYESHIFDTGGVPTRLNLHDFFNAAVWLSFPKAKAALNARQAAQIDALGVQHTRGVARDALTLFDENAAVLVTSDTKISAALRGFDWQNTLVNPRGDWDDPFNPRHDATAVVYAFGHALMEKLIAPRKAICAHVWLLHVGTDWFAKPLAQRLIDIDHRLATDLSEWQGNPRDFCPLPMLGVPHFCADNADKTFYNDERVFRSGRLRLA